MSLPLTTSQENARHSGQRNHLNLSRPFRAPSRNPTKLSLVGKAIYTLFPKALATYLGRDKEAQLLLRRSPAGTVRDWMRGRRKAPAWANEILIEELERRATEMWDLAAQIKKKGAG